MQLPRPRLVSVDVIVGKSDQVTPWQGMYHKQSCKKQLERLCMGRCVCVCVCSRARVCLCVQFCCRCHSRVTNKNCGEIAV